MADKDELDTVEFCKGTRIPSIDEVVVEMEAIRQELTEVVKRVDEFISKSDMKVSHKETGDGGKETEDIPV